MYMGVSAAPARSPPPAAATSQWGHTHARIRTSLRGSRRPVPEFARLVTATAAVGSRATRSGFGLPDTRCTLGSRSTCALGEAPVERGHSASHATGGGGAQEGPEYERGVKGPGEEPLSIGPERNPPPAGAQIDPDGNLRIGCRLQCHGGEGLRARIWHRPPHPPRDGSPFSINLHGIRRDPL